MKARGVEVLDLEALISYTDIKTFFIFLIILINICNLLSHFHFSYSEVSSLKLKDSVIF